MTPRQVAKALGLRRYQGKPCKYGHDGVRIVVSGVCASCGVRNTPEKRAAWNKIVRARRRDTPEKKAADNAKQVAARRDNLQRRLAYNLRTRICVAIRSSQRSGSAVRDLGCSISEFRDYIEAQFVESMSWDNWGVNGWHLDHKRPLASFDLSIREQFLIAAHYTNYQPLWAVDNCSKGDQLLEAA